MKEVPQAGMLLKRVISTALGENQPFLLYLYRLSSLGLQLELE